MTLTEVPRIAHLPAHWRAACVILTGAFPYDGEVWARVRPEVSIDLGDLIRDQGRPMKDRVLLAAAQGLADGRTTVPVAELVALSDSRLRLVLDALAIARGSLPID